MTLHLGFRALRTFCALALTVGVVTSAPALEPAPPDEEGIELDQAIQVLKEEATLLQRDADLARDALLHPPESRLSVYLSNKVPGLLIEETVLSVDGTVAAKHVYDELASRALLQKGALQRIEHRNIQSGPHRLRLTYKGTNTKGEPVSGKYEAAFGKSLDASELEIQILPGGRKSPPTLKLREWAAAPQ